jgi:hypothetical protein
VISTNIRDGSRSIRSRPPWLTFCGTLAFAAMIAASVGAGRAPNGGEWIGTWAASPQTGLALGLPTAAERAVERPESHDPSDRRCQHWRKARMRSAVMSMAPVH